MRISEIKKLAEKVAENHVDCSDESIDSVARHAVRLAELVIIWRGDFDLCIDEDQPPQSERGTKERE